MVVVGIGIGQGGVGVWMLVCSDWYRLIYIQGVLIEQRDDTRDLCNDEDRQQECAKPLACSHEHHGSTNIPRPIVGEADTFDRGIRATVRNYFSPASDHMLQCQPAALVAGFDLNGRVRNPETPVKFLAHLIDELVSRRAARHHKMACQSDFRRAHRPNMKIVDARNTGEHLQILAHVSGLNLTGYCLERKVHRVFQQTPCTPYDYPRND
jgi:hypothetical protein